MRVFYLSILTLFLFSCSACAPNKEEAFDEVDSGVIIFQKGYYSDAIIHFNSAINAWEDFHEAYYYRGCCYLGLNEIDLALKDFDKAIAIKSDYGNAYYSRGSIFSRLGKMNESCEEYKKAEKYGVNAATEKVRMCNKQQ